ncbi:unnamed protein product [Somion occarium]|uniref:Cytochrome P450 n=1 Tax=Somion occarium TaxID=3059160 RepID=A0ABP1DHW7_9APHY
MNLPLLSAVLVLCLVWVFNQLRRVGSREHGLPPGPPTIPLLGNLHIFPTSFAHEKFTEWAKTYGGIYSLKLASMTAVVISDPKLLRECLDLQGRLTSDRPPMYAAELIWEDEELVMTRSGPLWKTMRRAAHDILSRDACMKHLPIQRAEAVKLMYDLLERPKQFYTHVFRYAASVIHSMVFGIHCPEFDNSFLQDFISSMDMAVNLIKPGGLPPVELIPALKYIPERWAPWKQLCKEARGLQHGRRTDCFMEYLLDHQEQYGLDYEISAYLGGSLLQAGSFTTTAYLRFFIACITTAPDVLGRAQAEIDHIVGPDKLPELDDLENLPYLRAVINEVHRFRPIAPIAVPHASTTDVRVGEYIIPKGCTIFMNTWGIHHNEDCFYTPEVFDPERYLHSEFGTKAGVDTTEYRNDFIFGAGRRICPGSLLASNSIALNVMYMIWAFNFTPTRDPISGELKHIDLGNIMDGVVLVPKPFECEIRPRSAAKASLICREYVLATDTFKLFEHHTSVDC